MTVRMRSHPWMVQCPTCRGFGARGDRDCNRCQGEGWVCEQHQEFDTDCFSGACDKNAVQLFCESLVPAKTLLTNGAGIVYMSLAREQSALEVAVREAAAAFDALPSEEQQRQRHKQRVSFAYGNAAIDNPYVTERMVEEIARESCECLDCVHWRQTHQRS